MRLAELLGVDYATVYRYERKDRIPPPDILRKILAITKGEITPNHFFDLGHESAGATAVATGSGAAQTIQHRNS